MSDKTDEPNNLKELVKQWHALETAREDRRKVEIAVCVFVGIPLGVILFLFGWHIPAAAILGAVGSDLAGAIRRR